MSATHDDGDGWPDDDGTGDVPAIRAARQLTPKQIAFADGYARGLNKSEAARAAGYAPGSNGAGLAHLGTRNLRDQRVRTLIKHKREIYNQAALVTAADVVDGLWTEARNGANKGFERIKAYELIGRALGMFSDDANSGGVAAPKVTIYIPDNGRPVIDLRPVDEEADVG